MNFFEQFDFLGEKPKLYFNYKPNFKTNLGGILSILTFLVLLGGVIFFAKILLERSNFTVSVNEDLDPDSSINWTERDISIGLYDNQGKVLNDSERIYGITGLYIYSVKNGTQEKINFKPLNMEKCDFEKHFKTNKDLWKEEAGIPETTCLQRGQEFLITKKPFGATNFSYIFISVHLCNNKTKNDCYPENVIRQKLSTTFTRIRFSDVYLDHNNKQQTAKSYIYSDTPTSSVSIYKRLDYRFGLIDYYSDENYLLTDNSLSNYVTISDVKESVDLRPISTTAVPNTFFAVSLTNSIKKKIYYRRYYKVQNMMADVGGIIKAIILIATLINNIFVGRLYYRDIINYNHRNMDVFVDKTEVKSNVMDMSINAKESRLEIIKPIDENCDNPVVINIRRKNKIGNDKIHFPLYMSCIPKFLLSRNNNYRHVFDKLDDLTNLVKKQLDVKYIISKLNNIDKLSYMFFEYDYRSLLEGAPNPYIQDFIIKSNSTESESITTRLERNYNTLFNNK